MKKHKSDINKWPIPAGLFIGIGVGMLTGQVAAFTLIGFGVGLVLVWLRKN